jgi:hypothetical protein
MATARTAPRSRKHARKKRFNAIILLLSVYRRGIPHVERRYGGALNGRWSHNRCGFTPLKTTQEGDITDTGDAMSRKGGTTKRLHCTNAASKSQIGYAFIL